SYVRPLGERPGAKGGSRLPAALAQAARAPFPLSAPLAFGELMGRGARHLVRHIHPPKAEPPRAARHAHRRFRPVVRGSR
ncbi:MAG TPA: hypothetical protein VGV64_00300, partial [Thermoplasmata archaeon]|nr:hypothetical protein [Thermoplasmata archaeon]